MFTVSVQSDIGVSGPGELERVRLLIWLGVILEWEFSMGDVRKSGTVMRWQELSFCTCVRMRKKLRLISTQDDRSTMTVGGTRTAYCS